jgi:NTE family protein
MNKRITLVLGSGGPVGHAFHAGALRAIARALSWDPRRADLVLGTSAGAQVGALLRAGMSADDLCARVTGEPMSDEGTSIAAHYTRPDHDVKESVWRNYRPASTEYLKRGFWRSWRIGSLASAILPTGPVCLLSQAEGLRKLFGEAWPLERLWIAALCLHSGELLAFGKNAPATDVGTAVACSGAVPAVCKPIEVGGRSFIDGGMASATNLSLLHDADEDLVIVSSPLSSIAPMRIPLWREVRALRARGKRVVVLEPKGGSLSAMGMNPMALDRAPAVADAAYRSMLHEISRPSVQRELSSAL